MYDNEKVRTLTVLIGAVAKYRFCRRDIIIVNSDSYCVTFTISVSIRRRWFDCNNCGSRDAGISRGTAKSENYNRECRSRPRSFIAPVRGTSPQQTQYIIWGFIAM